MKNKFDSVFLSAPYTKLIDEKTKLINEPYKEWLSQILGYFKNKVSVVYNSHMREEWGASILNPSEAVKIDFDEILKADCIVAYIGDPPSPGVLMELGFAASYNKPILIFAELNQPIPYLVRGLKTLTKAQFLYFDDMNDLFRKFNGIFSV